MKSSNDSKKLTSVIFKANPRPCRMSKANTIHNGGYYFLKVSPSCFLPSQFHITASNELPEVSREYMTVQYMYT
jgi:hypothetical protein